MPAVKHSYDYLEEIEEPKKRSYQAVPIKKTKTGKSRKKAVDKAMLANFSLIVISTLLAVAFTAVYSIVALSEAKLTKLHAKISELNYENIDLENKLENVKSYYSVDTKVSSTADFDKAKNVLEVNHVDVKTVPHNDPLLNNNLNTVTGF